MLEHVLIDNVNYVYECLNCGFKSDPPWMTPPIDVSVEAENFFIEEHKDCTPMLKPV